MLQITNNSTVYLASKHIDFRKGIDGICAICRNQININPLDGAVFLFYNRLKNSIKVLAYDGQGFWLCSKRLSSGSFIWKSHIKKNIYNNPPLVAAQICYRILHVMINNGADFNLAKNWRNTSNNSQLKTTT